MNDQHSFYTQKTEKGGGSWSDARVTEECSRLFLRRIFLFHFFGGRLGFGVIQWKFVAAAQNTAFFTRHALTLAQNASSSK